MRMLLVTSFLIIFVELYPAATPLSINNSTDKFVCHTSPVGNNAEEQHASWLMALNACVMHQAMLKLAPAAHHKPYSHPMNNAREAEEKATYHS